MSRQNPFDHLPQFDPAKFQPPEWANSTSFDYTRKNGESSKSGRSVENLSDVESSNDEDDHFEDAFEDFGGVIEQGESGPEFTVSHLRELLTRAQEHKNRGNKLFTNKPPDLIGAKEAYQEAIAILPVKIDPTVSETRQYKSKKSSSNGIEEISEEEAQQIEADQVRSLSPEAVEREMVQEEIHDCAKACWSNLAACGMGLASLTVVFREFRLVNFVDAQNDYKSVVEASTKALEIDPDHVKALRRRGDANVKIGSWSSLTSAQEDYTRLLPLLSPQDRPAIAKVINTLPSKITAQQEKEKDEMLGKLKELGNGILGRFGLSTDMFKFEQQEGGGYNMKFER